MSKRFTQPSNIRKAAAPKWTHKQQEDKRPRYGNGNVYQSTRWIKCRKGYLMKHPICEKCRLIDITIEARVLDHIIPIRYADEQGRHGAIWDRDNWMALCDECHNRKRQKERYGKVMPSKPNSNGELIPVDRWAEY